MKVGFWTEEKDAKLQADGEKLAAKYEVPLTHLSNRLRFLSTAYRRTGEKAEKKKDSVGEKVVKKNGKKAAADKPQKKNGKTASKVVKEKEEGVEGKKQKVSQKVKDMAPKEIITSPMKQVKTGKSGLTASVGGVTSK